jgi:hypothetical protein
MSMNDNIRSIAVFRGLMIAGLGLLLTGCSEELGPTPIRSARVKGVVREGTHPVSGGWIEFFPVNGTVGNLRSAHLHADGSFEAEGVAVGENLLRLENAPIDSPSATQLFRSYGSPIRRVVTEQPAAPLDIDLVEEAIRYHRMQGRESKVDPSRPGEPR